MHAVHGFSNIQTILLFTVAVIAAVVAALIGRIQSASSPKSASTPEDCSYCGYLETLSPERRRRAGLTLAESIQEKAERREAGELTEEDLADDLAGQEAIRMWHALSEAEKEERRHIPKPGMFWHTCELRNR